MTPEEKAKELITQYKNILPRMNWMMLDETAKECALIAVDEILKGDHLFRSPLKFWQQVKEEINKI